MTDGSDADPMGHNVRGVVSILLSSAAELAADDQIPITREVLEAGAFSECLARHLPENAMQRVLRQARYQIACTLALPPRDPDDPLIDAVLEVLALHPTQVQARVLHAAAEHPPPTAPPRSATGAHGRQPRTPRP